MEVGGDMVYETFPDLIASIKQDVGRVANKIARGVAQVASEDLKTAHTEIMNDYYGGYTPVRSYWYHWQDHASGKIYEGYASGYRRKNNLRENSIVPLGVVQCGINSFSASIQVSSSNMDDYVNSTNHVFPASGVFNLVWNEGIRGLPPGNIGHIEKFNINTAPVGVWITGTPDEAMSEFVDNWGSLRGSQVADEIAFKI